MVNVIVMVAETKYNAKIQNLEAKVKGKSGKKECVAELINSPKTVGTHHGASVNLLIMNF